MVMDSATDSLERALVEQESAEFIKEGEENDYDPDEHPEDTIPDLPENQAAREFLKKAPKKGLFMPLGKEVKVMQCWRCKAYGHRTNDRECPMRVTGNTLLEMERQIREDPMSAFVYERQKAKEEKYERVAYLETLVEQIREEERERKRKKEEKRAKKKKRRKEK